MAQSNSESGKYAAMSRYYIRKADEYLQAGDRMQASEKGWGAVAEAVKSIAEERGWNHQSHRVLNDVVFQLSVEWGRPDVKVSYDAIEKLHINFYEDDMELDDITVSVGNAKILLAELATLRQRPPRAPAITNREQRNRWRRLTGELLPIEADAAGGAAG